MITHLQTGALVSQFPDAVKHDIHNFLADGVVASGIIIGRILLASDQLLWVEELSVRACSHLICRQAFQITYRVGLP